MVLPSPAQHRGRWTMRTGIRVDLAPVVVALVALLMVGGLDSGVRAQSATALNADGTHKYPEEVNGMLEFRTALTSNPAEVVPSWNVTLNPDLCQWAGIVCSDDGHVIYMFLYNVFLGGTLSPGLAKVTQLRSVDFHGTQLQGSIPEEFAALPNLVSVKLHINNLTGSIPRGFGRDTLRTLTLYANELSGPLPDSLWNATSLKQLNLFDNNLNGTISPAIGNLERLATLRLGNNKFSGQIPEEIGTLTELNFLGLENNSFTGPFPSSLTKLGFLSTLDLEGNQLSGPIPSSIFEMTDLVNLTLSKNNFTGSLPTGVAGLPFLQELDLDGNALSGPLPSDLGQAVALVQLDLQGNNFSGVPPSLAGLTNLTHLDLSQNPLLTGPLPAGLTAATKLETLFLQGNHWEGSIPESITALTALKALNLSNNFFNGTVSKAVQNFIGNRSGGAAASTQQVEANGNASVAVPSWVIPLQGNCLEAEAATCTIVYNGICVLPLQRSIEECVGPLPKDSSKNTLITIIILCVVGAAVLVALCVGGGLYIFPAKEDKSIRMKVKSVSVKKGGPIVSMRVTKNTDAELGGGANGKAVGVSPAVPAAAATAGSDGVDAAGAAVYPGGWVAAGAIAGSGANDVGVPEVTLEQLQKATDNFSTKIGSGSVADAYQATFGEGGVVVAKVLLATDQRTMSDRAFLDDVENLYRLQHRHLANLVAFCQEAGTRALVYQYVSGGSLYDRLHEGGPLLSWQERMRIAVGVALGLDYLHHTAKPAVVHGDIKSSNVLLTEDGAAKVSDFCINKEKILGSEGNPLASASNLRGGFGYVDPEYASDYELTDKSDVYSFGVLLFELVTGRKAMQEDASTLVVWVQEYLVTRDRLPQLLDPALKGSVPVPELEAVVAVAQACTRGSKSKRPTMDEVRSALGERLRIPPSVAAPQQEAGEEDTAQDDFISSPSATSSIYEDAVSQR